MFSIEHEFDRTVVTLVDEGAPPLREDVVVASHDDRIEVTQFDPDTGQLSTVVLSLAQMRDLMAAVALPEGVYTRADDKG